MTNRSTYLFIAWLLMFLLASSLAWDSYKLRNRLKVKILIFDRIVKISDSYVFDASRRAKSGNEVSFVTEGARIFLGKINETNFGKFNLPSATEICKIKKVELIEGRFIVYFSDQDYLSIMTENPKKHTELQQAICG